MARLVKCPVCGKMNNKEDTKVFRKRYYCIDCLKQKKIEIEKKKAVKDDWDILYNYLVELYGEKPTGFMFKQLGEYRKAPYNYTNMGILLTLKYFYETLGHKIKKGVGLGIVPYEYENAKNNFIRQRKVDEANSNMEYNNKKTYVKIVPEENSTKKGLIDFNSL